MYSEPCVRFTKLMMPKTSVSPAASRNNSTPYCTPLSNCDKTSVVIHYPFVGCGQWFFFTASHFLQKARKRAVHQRSVNFDPYSTVFYLYWIYSNILSQGFAQGFSATNVKSPL